MTQTAKFITFEGIDGAGKSTHIAHVERSLRNRGYSVLCTREPGGSELAESLRSMVLHTDMHTVTETLLMFAARADHISRVIAPALERGTWVLSDRFTDASYAYQGGGKGISWEFLTQLEMHLPRLSDGTSCKPDLTFLFDLPVAQAAARMQQRGQQKGVQSDRFEALNTAFFESVAAAYHQRMQQEPDRITLVDASLSLPEVSEQVAEVLRQAGW